MKSKWVFVAFFLFAGPFITFGQTAEELRAKYPEIRAYEVRPGILMTASFDPKSRIREMVFEKRHATDEKINLDVTLSQKMIIGIVEELIPVSVRGKKLKGFADSDNSADISGAIIRTEYRYENISVTFYGRLSKSCNGDLVAVVRWINKE